MRNWLVSFKRVSQNSTGIPVPARWLRSIRLNYLPEERAKSDERLSAIQRDETSLGKEAVSSGKYYCSLSSGQRENRRGDSKESAKFFRLNEGARCSTEIGGLKMRRTNAGCAAPASSSEDLTKKFSKELHMKPEDLVWNGRRSIPKSSERDIISDSRWLGISAASTPW